jgi:T5SS/PEP-CTERM-associated repeat protein
MTTLDSLRGGVIAGAALFAAFLSCVPPSRADIIWTGNVNYDVAAPNPNPGSCTPAADGGIDCTLQPGISPLMILQATGTVANGSVAVNGGSVLTSPNGAQVASNAGAGSAGALTVTGPGSRVALTDTGGGSLTVGSGPGDNVTVTVQDGGQLNVASFATIASGGGATGTLKVLTGGSLTVGNNMMIGVAGDAPGNGSLVIESGGSAQVTGNFGIGGNVAGSQGSVRVSGAGSQLSVYYPDPAPSLIGFGQNGATGTLQVDSGAGASIVTNGNMTLGLMGGAGNVIVDAATLSLSVGGDLRVGQNSTGRLTLDHGASATIGGSPVLLGAPYTPSDGKIEVKGSSVLELTSGSLGVSAGGSMSAQSGGEIYVGAKPVALPIHSPWAPPGTALVGVGTGGPGELTLGNGGSLTAQALLAGSRGTVLIGNGGVASVGTFEAGSPSDSAGISHATVQGANALLSATGRVDIAGYFGGAANVSVLDGARVETPSLTIGNSGSLTLANGAALAITGLQGISVSAASGAGGIGGDASLSVINGAQITGAGRIGLGTGSIVPPEGSTGNVTATIAGPGTLVQGFGVFVGDLASATATVSGGAKVEAQNMQIGYAKGSNGFLTVAGTGSEVTLSGPGGNRANLQVGRAGAGRLDITSGGKVVLDAAADGTTVIGLNIGGAGGSPPPDGAANANGIVNVDGLGSQLSIVSPYHITSVGRQGTGALNITNGGQVVHTDHDTTASVVGRVAGGTGTVLVDGVGSYWDAGKNLIIGADINNATLTPGGPGGKGTVTLAHGGALSVADKVYVEAGGTLQGAGTVHGTTVVDGGTVSPGLSPGTLVIDGNFIFHSGLLTIDVGGLGGGLLDRLRVTNGYAELTGGTILFSFINGFLPHAGDAFDFLVADALNAFENVALSYEGAAPGFDFAVASILGADGRTRLHFAALNDASAPSPGTLLLLAMGTAALMVPRRMGRSA